MKTKKRKTTFPEIEEKFAEATKELVELMKKAWYHDISQEEFDSSLNRIKHVMDLSTEFFDYITEERKKTTASRIAYYNKLVAAIKEYNETHPIRVFYIHRWPDGNMSAWCVEGPEYQDTIGSIWPGSMYYEARDEKERCAHVSAFDHKDAIEQAQELPEWVWKPKPPSKYWDLIKIIKEKCPDAEVIAV